MAKPEGLPLSQHARDAAQAAAARTVADLYAKWTAIASDTPADAVTHIAPIVDSADQAGMRCTNCSVHSIPAPISTNGNR